MVVAININNIDIEYKNSILDSYRYEVEYFDRISKVISMNVIVENIVQVDKDSHR